QHTSSPRRPAWPSHAARSLSPLLPLTSWLSQATPRAPISLGPPASAPARPRGPAAPARQRHVPLAPSLRSAASRAPPPSDQLGPQTSVATPTWTCPAGPPVSASLHPRIPLPAASVRVLSQHRDPTAAP